MFTILSCHFSFPILQLTLLSFLFQPPYSIDKSKIPHCLFPEIFRTCHQIHLEGAPILYGRNKFRGDEYCSAYFCEVLASWRNYNDIRRTTYPFPMYDDEIYKKEKELVMSECDLALLQFTGQDFPNIEGI